MQVEVEEAVVGLHLQAVKENAVLRDHGICFEVFQVETALFSSAQAPDFGRNRITEHIEIPGFQINAVKVEMGIVHQMLGCFLWFVGVLVPKLKVDVPQRNAVDDDGHRLRLLFFRRVGSKSMDQKSEIHLFLAFVCDEIGRHIAQNHM